MTPCVLKLYTLYRNIEGLPHSWTNLNMAQLQANTEGQMLFRTLAPDDELEFGRNQ